MGGEAAHDAVAEAPRASLELQRHCMLTWTENGERRDAQHETSPRRVTYDLQARRWLLAQMLQLAFVSTITGDYRDCDTLGTAALDMLAASLGLVVERERRTALLADYGNFHLMPRFR